jgi:PAS domain S-box-containing protein
MGKARILIVEDEAVVAENLEMAISDVGYDVVGRAASADDAINAAIEHKPDLILMDIVLIGNKTGIDASYEIKEKLDIPIIFLTAYSDLEFIDRAKNTEPYAYIVKPFQEAQLFASIEMALYKSQVARKLKESEEWFSTTLRSIGDAVIATDTRGCVTFMNPASEKLTGWKQEGAAGKPLEDILNIINGETGEKMEDLAAGVLRGRALELADHSMLVARDGAKVPIADSGAPIRDDKGDIIGAVLVFQDVTDRRQAEKRIEEEYRRAEFYIDLMGHDINNMSQVASGYLDLLLRTPGLPPESKKYVEVALGHVRKSADIVSGVKTLSEIRSGEVELAKIDIYPAFASAVATVMARPRDVEINADIPPGKYVIRGNTLLPHVFSNLLNNAVKFDRHDLVEIDVDISSSDDGKYWRLEFKDRGRGINGEYKTIIFNRLEQAGESAQGSGLGLTIAKYIVESYGGNIRVEDRIEGDRTQGSNFIVLLPKWDGD